jgi:hypothetical protein
MAKTLYRTLQSRSSEREASKNISLDFKSYDPCKLHFTALIFGPVIDIYFYLREIFQHLRIDMQASISIVLFRLQQRSCGKNVAFFVVDATCW